MPLFRSNHQHTNTTKTTFTTTRNATTRQLRNGRPTTRRKQLHHAVYGPQKQCKGPTNEYHCLHRKQYYQTTIQRKQLQRPLYHHLQQTSTPPLPLPSHPTVYGTRRRPYKRPHRDHYPPTKQQPSTNEESKQNTICQLQTFQRLRRTTIQPTYPQTRARDPNHKAKPIPKARQSKPSPSTYPTHRSSYVQRPYQILSETTRHRTKLHPLKDHRCTRRPLNRASTTPHPHYRTLTIQKTYSLQLTTNTSRQQQTYSSQNKASLPIRKLSKTMLHKKGIKLH